MTMTHPLRSTALLLEQGWRWIETFAFYAEEAPVEFEDKTTMISIFLRVM